MVVTVFCSAGAPIWWWPSAISSSYLSREVAGQVDTTQAVDWFDIFPPTPYQVGFIRAEQRDRFDQALLRVQQRGEDQRIRLRYLPQ